MSTTENRKECCDKAFREVDKNNTGYIDAKDLNALLRKCCAEKGKECSEEDINRISSKFHPKNGKISQQEFWDTLEQSRKECSEKEGGQWKSEQCSYKTDQYGNKTDQHGNKVEQHGNKEEQGDKKKTTEDNTDKKKY